MPPPPRVPDVQGAPRQARDRNPNKPRAFTAPPPKDGARVDVRPVEKAPAAKADAPRDRSAAPKMPALPRGRASMGRRGGGA